MGGFGSTSKRINAVNRKKMVLKAEDSSSLSSFFQKKTTYQSQLKIHGPRDTNDYQNGIPLNTERIILSKDPFKEGKGVEEMNEKPKSPESKLGAAEGEIEFMRSKFQGNGKQFPQGNVRPMEKKRNEGGIGYTASGNKFRLVKKVRKDWPTKRVKIQSSIYQNSNSLMDNVRVSQQLRRSIAVDSVSQLEGDSQWAGTSLHPVQEESLLINLPGGMMKESLAQEAPILRKKLEEYLQEEASKKQTKNSDAKEKKNIIYEKRIGNTKVQVSTDVKRENPMKNQPLLSQLVSFNLNTIDYLTKKPDVEKKIIKLVNSFDPLNQISPNYDSFIRFPAVKHTPKKLEINDLKTPGPVLDIKKPGHRMTYSESLFENDVMLKLELHQEMMRLADLKKEEKQSGSFSSDDSDSDDNSIGKKSSSQFSSFKEINYKKPPLELPKPRNISKQMSMNLDQIVSPLLKIKRPTLMNGSPSRIGTKSIYSNALNTSDYTIQRKGTQKSLSNFGQYAIMSPNLKPRVKNH